ncbi:uncharacterized protein TNCV_2998901 [Trichonephila clavipes]|nr:uncharacterized protein TNCV_2998901 [Trichonephila clavipes]
MYRRANGKGKAELRMYHVQFPDRLMPDHSIFQRLHRHFWETRSFHVTRHDASQRRAVRNPSQEESILNFVADRHKSSTRALAHHLSLSHQTVCRVLTKIAYTPSIFREYKPSNFSDCRCVVQQCALQLNFIAHVLNSYCKHYTCQRLFQ